MKLSETTRRALWAALLWDRRRVARFDPVRCAAYIDRQRRAEAALDEDVESWDREVRELHQTLLETYGEVTVGGAKHVLATGMGMISAVGIAEAGMGSWPELKAIAAEIGVLEVLRACGSEAWRG